jgi:hypothetical protein
MTTLLRLLTEPDYANDKTVVVMAGYSQDMADMMARNQGMASRFRRSIEFEVRTNVCAFVALGTSDGDE